MAVPDQTVEAGGKRYRFRFGIYAICALEDLNAGKPFLLILLRYFPTLTTPEEMLDEQTLMSARFGAKLNDLIELMLAGLAEYHPEVDRRSACRIVEEAGVDVIGAMLKRAVLGALPAGGGSEGTENPPA